MPAWTAGPSLRPIFGSRYGVDDRIVDLLATGLSQYRFQQRRMYPDVFSDDELRSVRVQALVMFGDKAISFEPVLALGRAESLIPSVQTVWSPTPDTWSTSSRPIWLIYGF